MHFGLESETASSPGSLKAFGAGNKAPTEGEVTARSASPVDVLRLAHDAFDTTMESPSERVRSNAQRMGLVRADILTDATAAVGAGVRERPPVFNTDGTQMGAKDA